MKIQLWLKELCRKSRLRGLRRDLRYLDMDMMLGCYNYTTWDRQRTYLEDGIVKAFELLEQQIKEKTDVQ